jgi:hypothetical protein
VIYKRADSQVDTAIALQNFSDVLRRQKKFSEALKKIHESRQIYEAMGHKKGLAGTNIQTGIILLESGNKTEVARTVHEGLKIAQEIGDRTWEMYAMYVYARLAAVEEDRQTASDLFSRCAAIARGIDDSRFILEILFHYGSILFHQNDLLSSYRLLSIARRGFGDKSLYIAGRTNSLLLEISQRLSSETIQQLEREVKDVSEEEAIRSVC